MGRLFPLLVLADLALLVIALIDCLSVEEHEIRALPRIAWVFIILLFSPVGGIVWFVAGRPVRSPSRVDDGAYWRRSRILAPDDDPEFLDRMTPQTRQEDEELLRAWEADLRRREEELRRDANGRSDDPPKA
jgi:hypothetical protein